MDDAHARLLEEATHAVREPAHDARLPFLKALHVDDAAGLGPCPEAEGVRFAHARGEVGDLDQRLARDAADAQAYAADAVRAVAIDERDAATGLRRAERRGIAAGTRADDDEIRGLGDLAHNHQIAPITGCPGGAAAGSDIRRGSR